MVLYSDKKKLKINKVLEKSLSNKILRLLRKSGYLVHFERFYKMFNEKTTIQKVKQRFCKSGIRKIPNMVIVPPS